MSFFRNIRSSITRGKSSSRDTSPVRNSRPSSVVGSTTSRRDSLDSYPDSQTFNRSETFILGDELTDKSASNSNCSTLEKKNKKSKVFGKFSTFTKRKKTPTPTDSGNMEHHPSDNATNTYYNWQGESSLAIDYDAQTDPFNFLYDQQSTLKALQQASASANALNLNVNSLTSSDNNTSIISPSQRQARFDTSTYRKNSKSLADFPLKEQLEQLKTLTNGEFVEDDCENEEDEKYRTVTLNSFRKSFRDRFLEQQQEDELEQENLQKPAWFVQVEKPKSPKKNHRDESKETKENRSDYLVFANENYRPGSRSPIRGERPSRSKTRSPVKRNETFKVESPLHHDNGSSIQIAFRNSIRPQAPVARIVPVGVAKPMPTADYYRQRLTATTNANSSANHSYSSPVTTKASYDPHPHPHPQRKASKSPIRNFFSRSSGSSSSPLRHNTTSNITNTNGSSAGRFQTLVHINNDTSKSSSPLNNHTTTVPVNSRLSTKVQLGMSNHQPQQISKARGSLNSDYHNSLARLSYANIAPPNGKSHNFIGGSHMAATIASANKRQPVPFGAGYILPPISSKSHYQPQGRLSSSNATLYLGQNQLTQQSQQQQQQRQNQKLQQHQHYSPLHQHHYQQLASPASQKSRVMVSTQRRSRSPIKIPWR